MSTTSERTPALPRGRSRRRLAMSAGPTLHRRLAAFVGWLVRAIGSEVAARRSIRTLAAMSERGLSDLGLSRGDVERVARHGRF